MQYRLRHTPGLSPGAIGIGDKRGRPSWTPPLITALTVATTSDTEQTVTATFTSAGEDGVSFEYSTDNVNFTVKGTGANHLDAAGLTAGTLYYWRARVYKGVKFGEYSSVYSGTTYAPFFSDALFLLRGDEVEIDGDFYLKDSTVNGRNFLITGRDWSDDSRVYNLLPFKTFATISAPAGDTALIAADVDNFLYAGDGTPNEITAQMLFQNIDYKDKLFCRHVDHVLNADNTEFIYSGVKDIILYANTKITGNLTTCNTYFGVPNRVTGALWVGLDGNDTTGNGSEATPYKTIGKATTEATGTKTIYIKTGIYTEYITLANSTVNRHFFGLGGTKITTANANYVFYIHDGTGISNFTRITTFGTHVVGGMYMTGAPCEKFEYCDIQDNSAYSINGQWTTIQKNRFIRETFLNISAPIITNFTDNITKDCKVDHWNRSVATGKSIITYNKSINTTNTVTYYLTGSCYDYKYNISYLSGTGGELYAMYYSATKESATIQYNKSYLANTALVLYSQSAALRYVSLNCSNNTVSQIGVNATAFSFLSPFVGDAVTIHNNIIDSQNAHGVSFCDITPITSIPCTISIKYNNIQTKSTITGAIINFTESVAYNGADLVFKNAEIMYNYITGGIVDYPANTQNCHGILARSGNNMKIAYNYVKNCAIGIVYKTEDVPDTSGGVYNNVLIDNRVGIYLRSCHDSKIYGNTIINTLVSTSNAQLIIANAQSVEPCKDVIITNNIMYRNNSPANTGLFNISNDSLLNGTKLINNIIYSPDTGSEYFENNGVINLSLVDLITSGYAEDISEVDPEITTTIPYPVPAIEGATDLGAAFEYGLDISSVWSDAVVLKTQGANWQYGAYVQ